MLITHARALWPERQPITPCVHVSMSNGPSVYHTAHVTPTAACRQAVLQGFEQGVPRHGFCHNAHLQNSDIGIRPVFKRDGAVWGCALSCYAQQPCHSALSRYFWAIDTVLLSNCGITNSIVSKVCSRCSRHGRQEVLARIAAVSFLQCIHHVYGRNKDLVAITRHYLANPVWDSV